MKFSVITAFFLILLDGLPLYSCTQDSLQLYTDFKNVQVDQETLRLVGTDESGASVFDRYTKNRQGCIFINYETKNLAAAKAEVVEVPNTDGKMGLHLRVANPNVYKEEKPLKSRIQLELHNQPGFSSFVSEVSIFLPNTMNELNQCPYSISWLTLQEFWNTFQPSHNTTFRISIGLWKSKNGRLYFGFKAQNYIAGKFVDISRGDEKCVEVPIGQWFRLRTEVIEGNSTNGFFQLTLIDDGRECVLYQRTMQTMSTAICEGRFPSEGFNNIQPIKIYTSAWLTEWMKDRGCTIEAYFTDWSFSGKHSNKN